MPPKGTKNISIPEELYERLKVMRRPHQAIAGVIEELLSRPQRPNDRTP